MSGNKLLLDTNIILYLLRGDTTLVNILEGKQVYISFVTELELYSFKELNAADRSKIDAILEACSIIDINAGVKAKTIEVRRLYKIKLPDSIIAGTALYFKMPLITADKDFEKIEELNLLNYEI
ncbi:type II toxin-antitoxin system VapC family toxin [Aquimarina sp. ERC-38]|uniref:type II toxin-antitoxin system VapC family toxin n=1 Tax=Aquimarina sp. ERC-38 TaxID=2949996 RepID=UPI0022472E61|nr:type II toxin-antitoxin system VapC family toxin [Aquimarina sp. ERC-38]UZO82087.1 type II toxin-antitoxin system VapC family toxin [Aquimarina sp. ERC-38]